MVSISKEVWQNYINGLEKVSEKAKEEAQKYIETHEVDSEEGRNAKYGEAASEFACQMYDAISELEGAEVDPAEPAEPATFQETAKAVNGTMKNLLRLEITGAAIGRLVKLCGQDTTLKNAIRDRAFFAWIPVGDTCPFCLSIAAEGWQRASQNALKGGHAEHIHGNCNCAYTIKHDEETVYKSYDPSYYQELFDNAEGSTEEEKLNSIRRMAYDKNSAKIRAQKRSAYQKSKELESSQAEEINVN